MTDLIPGDLVTFSEGLGPTVALWSQCSDPKSHKALDDYFDCWLSSRVTMVIISAPVNDMYAYVLVSGQVAMGYVLIWRLKKAGS